MSATRTVAYAAALLMLCSCDRPKDDLANQPFSLTADVERWRELVEKYFRSRHVTWALEIIACESGGDPRAYNQSSGASGLFQHLPAYWSQRAAAAGFAGYDAFDPEANIAASAYLLYAPGGGPSHWVCSYSPFEDPTYQPRYYDDDGNPVRPCQVLAANGGIIDDTDSCFQKFGPSAYWRQVSGEGYGGSLNWTNATQAQAAANWARWNVELSAAGRYRVSYYAVSAYARFTATRYVVRHAGIETELIVDQSLGNAGFRILGSFDFAAGGDQFVAVYDNTPLAIAADQHIVADAIQLEPDPQQPVDAGVADSVSPLPDATPAREMGSPRDAAPTPDIGPLADAGPSHDTSSIPPRDSAVPRPDVLPPVVTVDGSCSLGTHPSASGPRAPLVLLLLFYLFRQTRRR